MEKQLLIKDKINSLKDDIQTLEQTLRLAADNLQKNGQLPEEKVIHEITQCSQVFKDLVEETADLSDSKFEISSSLIHTVTDLNSIIEAYIEHHDNNQEQLENALTLTKQMMFIKHTKAQEFDEINKVIENAKQIFQDLTKDQDNELIASLNSYQHVLAQLYDIMKNREHLSDDELDEYLEPISLEYGTKISKAADRGRLVFDDINVTDETNDKTQRIEEKIIKPSKEDVPDNTDVEHESDNKTQSVENKVTKPSAENKQPHTALDVQNKSITLDIKTIGSQSAVLALSEEGKSSKIKRSIIKAQIMNEIEEREKAEGESSKKSVENIVSSPHVSEDEKENKLSEPNEKPLNETLKQSDETELELPKENGIDGSLSLHASEDEKEIHLEIQEKEGESSVLNKKPLNEIVSGEVIRDKETFNETDSEDLFDLVLELLKDKNKRSFAYHITKIQNEMSTTFPFPIELIRSVILGLSTFSSRHQEYLSYFTKDFEKITYIKSLQYKDNYINPNLLIAAALIQPTIFSPSTIAAQILLEIPSNRELPTFYKYCQEIAKFGSHYRALDIYAVKGDIGIEQDKRNFQDDIQLWWEKVVHMDLTFGLARKIRNQLISSNGLLYQIYTSILEDDNEIYKYIQGLDKNSIESYIRKVEKEVNNAHRNGVVTGSPLKKLHTIIEDGLDFAEAWHKITVQDHKQESKFAQENSKILKTNLAIYEKDAIFELTGLIKSSKNLYVQVSASLCLEAIDNLKVIFNPDKILSSIKYRMPMNYLLNIDLLRLKGVLINEEWEVEDKNDSEILDIILDFIEKNSWDWKDVFLSRASACELESTKRIIKYLSDNNKSVTHLKEKQSQMLIECRDKLEQKLIPTRKKIENAVALGLLDESLRLEQQAIIDEIEQQFMNDFILRFSSKLMLLNAIENRILDKTLERTKGLHNRLNLIKDIEDDDRERIEKIINTNDVLTANEYLDMIERKESLPTESRDNNQYSFSAFFPDNFVKLEDTLNTNTFAKVAKMVKGKKSIKGLSWQNITAAHLARASTMLDNWLGLKRLGKIDLMSLRELFTSFGFNVEDIKVNLQNKSISSNYTWIDLKTETIADKKICHAPEYGSIAKGNYKVLCSWDNPTDDELMNEIGETKHLRTPVIVLFFNKLSENRRRRIARLCRDKDRLRTYIIIDDIITLFLTSATGSRLPLLFTSTLPFTYLEPYASTAGLVPPEMFYGRNRERLSIIDPRGSCFIYGGRQLGKTALLRDIERTYHVPKDGHIVIWLDLKIIGLGTDTALDDIWYYLAQSLHKEGVFKDSPKRTITFDKLSDRIVDWLDKNHDRRILFLLDESDHFLEGDGVSQEISKSDSKLTGFSRSTKLKGLMDTTERRFKIVFAGLHNVQRTTKLANHPLAHFGENICIGPLLENGESREAHALIKEPLEAIGFKISTDLVTRILSQTNYYPSLIQIYCEALILHINKHHLQKFDDKNVPPYEILSLHVEEAYQSTSLRKSIKDRFLWTLQLDQRYEVIAYIIARETFINQDDSVYQQGFTLNWIEKEAKSWWQDGFKDNLGNNILVLLDEMVDLGVLRTSDNNRFALRSHNVGLLLGSEEEIDSVLLKEREIPHEYEPSISRSIFFEKKKADYSRRNPLTAYQESVFRAHNNDVSIIFGSELSLLPTVTDFLKATFIDQLEILPALSDVHEYMSHIDKLIVNRLKEELPMIILVDQNSAWTRAWINESIQKLNRLRDKKAYVHIVFLSEPNNSWILLEDQPNLITEFKSEAINIIKLAPWHDQAVRQWFEDIRYINYDENNRKAIYETTGNWHILLEDFYTVTKKDKSGWKNKLDQLEEQLLNENTFDLYLEKSGITHLSSNLVESLKNLAALGSMTSEEIYELNETQTSQDEIDRLLLWAYLLNYIVSDGNGVWRIDPLIQKLLLNNTN